MNQSKEQHLVSEILFAYRQGQRKFRGHLLLRQDAGTEFQKQTYNIEQAKRIANLILSK
jgi:hypothetical protein